MKTKVQVLEDLSNLVPNWEHVDLTKMGYNAQYIETLRALLDYIDDLVELKDE